MFIRHNSPIRQEFLEEYGVDLPISGGSGNSIDMSVIIEYEAGPNYQEVEDTFINCLSQEFNFTWSLISREVKEVDGLVIEVVSINWEFNEEEEDDEIAFSPVKEFYFDITRCVAPESAGAKRKSYQDFPDLINELEARDAVFRADFNTEQSNNKSPWLFPGGKGRIGELDKAIWHKLFNGQITEDFALDAMTDLMEEYYGRNYPLRRK